MAADNISCCISAEKNNTCALEDETCDTGNILQYDDNPFNILNKLCQTASRVIQLASPCGLEKLSFIGGDQYFGRPEEQDHHSRQNRVYNGGRALRTQGFLRRKWRGRQDIINGLVSCHLLTDKVPQMWQNKIKIPLILLINFDHFQIFRAIGKGSFGKVCIVQKKDTKKMFAMKYMNKKMCIEKDAIRNVFREVELLMILDHPFLVNLWFTFQDEEDMFMVVDLLLGGDLRYHIQQEVKFDEPRVKLYICEMAMALDYLQKNNIVHRDIKPDNILLDEEGHVHITDFNIAAMLPDGQMATSMSGTKPYMAPEVFACALDDCAGYTYPVDWWSMGVCAYEMMRGRRPFDVHSSTGISDMKYLFGNTQPNYPSKWEEGMRDVLKQLLVVDPLKRISSLDALKSHRHISDVDFDSVYRLEIKPSFVPSKDHLNCDPTYELEEMIIEAKPLHKKKKRLAKQNSKREHTLQNSSTEQDPMQACLENIDKQFKLYNREREARDHANKSTESGELCKLTVKSKNGKGKTTDYEKSYELKNKSTKTLPEVES